MCMSQIQQIVFAGWLMEIIGQSFMSAEVNCKGLAMRRKESKHGQWIKAFKTAPLQLPEVSVDSLRSQGPRGGRV